MEKEQNKRGVGPLWRRICLVVLDILIVNAAVFFALMIRFDFCWTEVPAVYVNRFLWYMPIHTVISILILWISRLYRSLWQFASMQEAITIVIASVIVELFHFAGSVLLSWQLPRSCYILSGMLTLFFVMASRFVYRMARFLLQEKRLGAAKNSQRCNVMVIGAGDAGNMLMREIDANEYMQGRRVVCVIDDDNKKVGQYIGGVRIVGTCDSIVWAAKEYKVNEIVLAMPSASMERKAEILNICKETGCALRTLPGVYQLVNGEVKLNSVRDVSIEDLLGREPIGTGLDAVMEYVRDKVVLVTGGGGSIGSELCRQLAAHAPRQLIIFDIYENNAYEIEMELRRQYPELDIVALIGSVRDTHRINGVFAEYRPQIVYHAAAHKHVPLMEESPHEAVKNNVFGTLKTVQAADRYGAQRFVMISTDKAVNPTNVMGATKRLCEMIVQAYNRRSKTEFVAVRFGNVLGSNGSVIPLFKKQIEEGGPVRVTHPDIIRYFMTIPEAVSLVLQAGAKAQGGEIFVLNMGKPMKILDLAENLIRLSGHVPYVDIDIQFTGLRPGEKLYEELLMSEEGLTSTQHSLIFVGKPMQFDEDEFFGQLEELRSIMMDGKSDVRAMLRKMVPSYRPAEDLQKKQK